MTKNLLITFKAESFPLDGAPSPARAAAAAHAFVAEVKRVSPGNNFEAHINEFNDGALVIVYEPYHIVGDLEATALGGHPDGDSTGTIVLYGKTEQRTEYDRFYPAAHGHAISASDPLAPRYQAGRSPGRS